MTEVLAALLLCGTFFGTAWLVRPFADRLLKIAERRLELEEGRSKRVGDTDPIPVDLFAGAMQHSESWAREDAVKLLYEKRAELGSWNAVRTSSIAVSTNVES
jgi:hypothetical protein